MDTDSDSEFSDRPPVDLYVEEGELSDQDPDATADPDQTLSEDQSYRETLWGIRSYMGWNLQLLQGMITPLQDHVLSQRARYLSVYLLMTGFVKRWPS